MSDELFVEFGKNLQSPQSECVKCTLKVMESHAICMAKAGADESKKKACLTATQVAIAKCPCPG